MNLTNLILLKTIFGSYNLTYLMNSILVSNKIENIVLYYQNHTLDVANAVLLSQFASIRTFSILELKQNQNEIARRNNYTFYIYLVDLEGFFDVAFSRYHINIHCRHLFLIEKKYINEDKFIDTDFWEHCNIAIAVWQNEEIFVYKYQFNNKTVVEDNTWYGMDTKTNTNFYELMFIDNVFDYNQTNCSFSLVPFFFPPNEMVLATIMNETQRRHSYDTGTNYKYFTGRNIYLTELICEHFGCAFQMYSVYTDFYLIKKNYKDYMKDQVVELKTLDNQPERSLTVATFPTHLKISLEIYPFDEDKLVIIVPNRLIATSLLLKIIFESPLLCVWSFTILLTTTVRLGLNTNRMKWPNNIGRIVLDTFSIAFTGAGFVQISKRSERVLILTLSVFSFLSSIVCTGFIFQQYISQEMHSTINSVEDLNKSGIQIYGYPIYFNNYMNETLHKM